ncbi:MAG: RNA 2',3'-cyclic phosphodiesterase, partial [Wenzhouxiangellaceae bacterium]|nr:RNA 2',3'-cyclic phosphodiesterase [Wenzhouxiangellaceae bacterium]
MSGGKKRRRLFFALWPSPQIRAGIVRRREAIEGLSRRRVPDHNLHLTLLFLGDQRADRVPEITAAARRLHAPGFDLVLDRLGCFARARVAWLGGQAPAAGNALVADLTAGMEALDLGFDHR